MAPTLGILQERGGTDELFRSQCDGPGLHHGGIELRANDSRADHVLCLGAPIPAGGRPRLDLRDRVLGALFRDRSRRKTQACWTRLGHDRSRTVVLILEPPSVATDQLYELARRHAIRVYGPDPRATNPTVLPATWEVEGGVHALRRTAPGTKPVPLAAVISGKSFVPGHRARLGFLTQLRQAGVPLELFGRGLPSTLGGRGETSSKAAVFGPARLALAIENYAEGGLYVSEKLWDPLLAWSLPLYFGSKAADGLIPHEAFIRLPNLGADGVRVVRDAVADPTCWSSRLDAIAEARRRVLGDLRLVEWARQHVVEGCVEAEG